MPAQKSSQSSKILFRPSRERVAAARITKFQAEIEKRHSCSFSDYSEFHRWSVEHPESFWPAVVDFCKVHFQRKWSRVFEGGSNFQSGKWFLDSQINFAENLLRHANDPTFETKDALVSKTEVGEIKRVTYGELGRQVAAVSSYLKAQGIQQGDRVCAYLPNIPETVVAMLATTAVGATWSSCSPDFGATAVIARFSQISPKLLFCTDGYTYNGKSFECLPRIREILSAIPSIQKVVVVPHLSDSTSLAADLPGDLYPQLLRPTDAALTFEALPFDHPTYILYSSGTTGAPKCIVHGAGGTLLQHVKELVLHTGLHDHDRIFYFTTCGWMMWNWLVSSLQIGATVYLYDGSPFYPTPLALFDFVQDEKISIFGTNAKYLQALEKQKLCPAKTHDLAGLKAILSTGSPLLPDSFDYVYQQVKSELTLSSISGGTDIVSCFALGNPALPVRRGELQVAGLGMDVAVYDESANPIVGKPGELVCRSPFPSMPIFFWNDPDGQKFNNAYFTHYKNIWRHGDWAEQKESGGFIIFGRSDSVLNPGGIRIGTAELYQQVDNFTEIAESVVVGQKWKEDERIILFVRMCRPGTLDDSVRERLKKQIRNSLSPRHVPAKIIEVPEIPRTMNGKITELAVKNAINGRPIANREVLANPDALEYFKQLAELEQE